MSRLQEREVERSHIGDGKNLSRTSENGPKMGNLWNFDLCFEILKFILEQNGENFI